MSVSWGQFQLMGESYKLAGFPNVQMCVSAMCRSEQEQLTAFVNFIQSKKLEEALRTHDWLAFAKGYNGNPKKHPESAKKYADGIKAHYEALCKK